MEWIARSGRRVAFVVRWGGGGGAVCGRVGAFDQGACEFGGRWAACGWVGRLRRVSESSEGGRARRRRDGGKRGD